MDTRAAISVLTLAGSCLMNSGCTLLGYSDRSVFPQEVNTVCIQTFENRTFHRDLEYELTSALAKMIEAQTPYRIISDPDLADSVLSGQILDVHQSPVYVDRQSGRVEELDLAVRAIVNWKDLRSGRLLLNSQAVEGLATRDVGAGQGFDYASSLAVNRLAQQVVHLMEKAW